jgi:hypothetical protein
LPSTSAFAKVIVLNGEPHSLEVVPDELFMDLHQGAGTEFLAGTCYGQAVRDCKTMGENYFILKVRPELRSLLLSQLRQGFKVFRVYRFEGDREGRILLTDEISIRFDPIATDSQRRDSLQRFFPTQNAGRELKDGIFRLTGTFLEDPILVANALQENPLVVEAVPVLVALPRPAAKPKLAQKAEVVRLTPAV